MKKKICLITDWYPTPENPYHGLFFKEQAIALEDKYEFLVIRYKEIIKRNILKSYTVTRVGVDRNIEEYCINVYVPIRMYFFDLINDIRTKVSKNTIEGCGKYISKNREEYRCKIIGRIQNGLKLKYDVLYCVDAQDYASILKCFSQASHKPYIVGEHAPVPWPGKRRAIPAYPNNNPGTA